MYALIWFGKQAKRGIPTDILKTISADDLTKYSDGLVDAIRKSNGFADDIVKCVNKYGDDAAKAISKCGDDAVVIISTYGDDAAKIISKHGKNGVDIIYKYGDDIVPLITKYGDDAVEVITKYGDDAARAIKNGIEPSTISILEKQGFSPENYIKINSAEEINQWWKDFGYDQAPYKPETKVIELELPQDKVFVRVYDNDVSGKNRYFFIVINPFLSCRCFANSKCFMCFL